MKCSRGLDDGPIGQAHANPLFDTREHEVEFADGTMEKCDVNTIAENVFAQVDEEGNQHLIVDETVDHKREDDAIPIAEGFAIGKAGNKMPKITTRGWLLLMLWKDGSTSWEKLKDVKESNPAEVVECAVGNRIAEEPAFDWWAPHTLRRQNHITSKLKKRCWRTSHKFGVRLPHSVEEALEIDKETGTDFWKRAIEKEMSRVKAAWRIDDSVAPDDT